MKKQSINGVLIIFMGFFLQGCVKLALQLNPSLIPHFTKSLFEECDPELAKQAIPANLKLMEGLIKNDPDNTQILTTLSMGFTGYSMLFVEADDPGRASDLYLRARNYGLRALGEKGLELKKQGKKKEHMENILKAIGKKELKPFLWAIISWNAWINLNLDKPDALSQLSITQRCIERVMELDAQYLYGLPCILMGISLSARPPMFGGKYNKAKSYFETALKMSDGKFFFAQYYFARYYAVRVQDKKLFFKLIQDIIDGNPSELKDVCLINTVMQHRANELKKITDEFFF